MTDASSPGQLPETSTTAAPGWYPDLADPRYNRWWDGSAWTAHVGPPASQLMAQRPPISASTPVYNAFTWIIAGLPLVPAVWMAIITVGSYKNMVWMQSMFSGMGYGS